MNFGSEVKNLDKNWEAKIGTVATTVWKNFLGHNSLLKIMKFIGSELLDVTKIPVLESAHCEQHGPQCNKFFKGLSWENSH